jgi:hypothetical protein
MDKEHSNKCGHAGCQCLIKPGEHFCSDYCSTADPTAISGTLPGKRDTTGKCKCGHPDCK